MKFYSIAAMLVLIPTAANAQGIKDGLLCSDKVSTMDIVECIDRDTKTWDKRLNAGYRALGPVVDQGQREPLKIAQRLWIQYRDANCGFYGAHEGTIRQILAADCVWTMTRDRTLELEQAAKP